MDADGATVLTLLDGALTPAGTVTRVFDGKRPDGTFLPGGSYRSVVTLAGDGSPTISQYRTFKMMAFAISLSDTTPARGQSVTVSATSARSLSSTPRVYVYQPGKTTWSVAMSKVGYRQVPGAADRQDRRGDRRHPLPGQCRRCRRPQPVHQPDRSAPLTRRRRHRSPANVPVPDRTGTFVP
ncbi:MAG: hypothetical protein WKF78_06975 [Candidatus Limnocylindrales bacterium]